jgi:nucleotide-binding universal stress UspA family protein
VPKALAAPEVLAAVRTSGGRGVTVSEEEIADATRGILEPLVAEARAQQVEADALARHGHAGATLAEIADERGAKQIFVGRRGVSKVKALLFGSVSVGLVQVSTVPVTVVP